MASLAVSGSSKSKAEVERSFVSSALRHTPVKRVVAWLHVFEHVRRLHLLRVYAACRELCACACMHARTCGTIIVSASSLSARVRCTLPGFPTAQHPPRGMRVSNCKAWSRWCKLIDLERITMRMLIAHPTLTTSVLRVPHQSTTRLRCCLAAATVRDEKGVRQWQQLQAQSKWCVVWWPVCLGCLRTRLAASGRLSPQAGSPAGPATARLEGYHLS